MEAAALGEATECATLRARLEEALARLDEVQRIGRIGLWEHDCTAGRVHWSDEVFRIFGVDATDFVPSLEALGSLVPQGDHERLMRHYRDALAGHAKYDVVHRIRPPGGGMRWVHERCEVERGADGRPLRSTGTIQDVTDLQEAVRGLREREYWLGQAERIAGLGHWGIDFETGVGFWSENQYRLHGTSTTAFEPTVDGYAALLHPDDRERVHRLLTEFIAGRGDSTLRAECRVVIDGETRILQHEGHLLQAADGRPERMFGVTLDVSDRRRADQRLQAALTQLEMLVANIPVLLWCLDFDGTVTLSEGLALEHLGLAPGMAVGRSYYEMFAAYPDLLADVRRALAGETVQFARAIEGRFYEALVGPMVDASGVRIGMIGVALDVTERKHTESELQRTYLRHRAIAAAVRDPLYMTDAAGRLVQWNESFVRASARDASMLAGLRFDQLVAVADRALANHAAERVRASGYAEVELRFADGLVYRFSGSAMRDENGAFIGICGVGWDVTELRDREAAKARFTEELERQVAERTAALLLARDAAEQASLAKSTFLSRMSHELRTPLNAVLGFAQLLRTDRKESLTATQRESVEEIESAARHLLELISEVLDLAAVESAGLRVNLAPVELSAVLRHCASLFMPLLGERDIRLEFAADCTADAWVLADETRVRQVVINLLSNAVKYSRPRGRIEIGWRAVGASRWRVTVRDEGMGIESDELDAIFEPFRRGRGQRLADDGVGIGLALSKALVEAMRGTIGVSSQVDRGSCFHFDLPRADGVDSRTSLP